MLLGNAFYKSGNLRAAVKRYRRALRCDRSDADISCNLGDALYELGYLGSAIKVYRKGVDRSPEHTCLRCKLGNALYDARDLEGAAKAYAVVLASDPDHYEASYNLWCTQNRMRKKRVNARKPPSSLEHINSLGKRTSHKNQVHKNRMRKKLQCKNSIK